MSSDIQDDFNLLDLPPDSISLAYDFLIFNYGSIKNYFAKIT